MNQIIKNVFLREQCSLFKKEVVNITFQNCSFEHLVLSDIKFENVDFINCKFDRVLIESFYAENIRFFKSEILFISLREARSITSKRLFSGLSRKGIERVVIDNSNKIEEISLGGNLHVVDCSFPTGPNYLHLKKPFEVYTRCLEFVDKHWEGEKRRVGLEALQTLYIAKQVEMQDEDFITYLSNEYLEKETNEILRSVFLLIKEKSSSIDQDVVG